MMDRSKYRDLINEIEANYTVNDWIHNGYHVWPILRIRLFMMMVRQFEGSRHSGNNTSNIFHTLCRKIKVIPKSWYNLHQLDKSVDYFFCGAPSHRVIYQGKHFNRYFDHIIDKRSYGDDLLLEYGSSSKTNYYKPGRVLLVGDLLKCSRLDLKAAVIFGRKNKYAQMLDIILQKEDLQIKNYVFQATRYISNVDQSVSFFEKLLRKTRPEKVYELCYYSSILLGLNIAAHRMGIKTIDVQHGPQGENHLAYGAWDSIPQAGYEALPNEFHSWDESSANIIEQWTRNTTKHSATVTGNPWVEGWKKGDFESTDFSWPDNLILYTLQPTGNPLEPYLLEAIKKTAGQWNWWLRVHPRQKTEINSLKNTLRQHGLLAKINMDDATELLLPEILVNTQLHLTKFSGCAIEAFNFETPSIILDKRGEEVFKDYFAYDLMQSYVSKKTAPLVKMINSYL